MIDTKRGRELREKATHGGYVLSKSTPYHQTVYGDDGDKDIGELRNEDAECMLWLLENAPALLDAAEECERLRAHVESLLSRVEDVTGAREPTDVALACKELDQLLELRQQLHEATGDTFDNTLAQLAGRLLNERNDNRAAWVDARGECERLRSLVAELAESGRAAEQERCDQLTAEKRRADEAERNYAACAHAIGIEHAPETGPTAPGPVKAVVWHIKEALSQAMDRQDAVIRADEAEREREAMRDALRAIAHAKADSPVEDDETLVFHMGEVARAALAGKGGG